MNTNLYLKKSHALIPPEAFSSLFPAYPSSLSQSESSIPQLLSSDWSAGSCTFGGPGVYTHIGAGIGLSIVDISKRFPFSWLNCFLLSFVLSPPCGVLGARVVQGIYCKQLRLPFYLQDISFSLYLRFSTAAVKRCKKAHKYHSCGPIFALSGDAKVVKLDREVKKKKKQKAFFITI